MKKQRFKVLSLLLALSLTAAGCGKTAGTASSSDSAKTSSAQTAESVSASGAATAESTASAQAANSQSSQTESTPAAAEDTSYGVSPAATTDEYTLKKVVIMSRHNIRAPLSGGDSLLGKMTPHSWFPWTSNASELSLKGGILETMMGQYFKKWMESEGLIPENYHPAEGEVRFYANAKQRTQATARYFASGMLPTAPIEIEQHVEFDTMDPVFTPQLTVISDEIQDTLLSEIAGMGGESGIAGLGDNLADAYALLADVLDVEESEAYKSGEFTGFKTDDTEIVLTVNEEPGMKGSLKTATSLSDALILQYYENLDDKEAAFGHDLTKEDWLKLASIKDAYSDILYTGPSMSVNIAHPLLQEIYSELNAEGRIFTFLCGHDSNIAGILAAMQVQDYSLPETLERKTPIGFKLVFEIWEKDGEEYCAVNLCYQSTDQIRNLTSLSLEEPPVIVSMNFNGLEKNEDGLYMRADVENRLMEAINAYDALPADTEEELAPAA